MHSTAQYKHTSFSVQLIAGLVIIGMVLVLAAALAVPFLFPTETLWYKAGVDKLMLLTAQMVGLLALVLLLVQILLALRPKVFEQILGTAPLLRWHRANGVVLAGCALVHVVLVLAPEGLGNLPLGWKFWPELLGAFALLCLLATVTLSWWRSALHLPYHGWRLLHRVVGYLLPVLLTAHVLSVSESFAGGLPRLVLLVGMVLFFLLVALMRMRRGRATPTTHPRRSL